MVKIGSYNPENRAIWGNCLIANGLVSEMILEVIDHPGHGSPDRKDHLGDLLTRMAQIPGFRSGTVTSSGLKTFIAKMKANRTSWKGVDIEWLNLWGLDHPDEVKWAADVIKAHPFTEQMDVKSINQWLDGTLGLPEIKSDLDGRLGNRKLALIYSLSLLDPTAGKSKPCIANHEALNPMTSVCGYEGDLPEIFSNFLHSLEDLDPENPAWECVPQFVSSVQSLSALKLEQGNVRGMKVRDLLAELKEPRRLECMQHLEIFGNPDAWNIDHVTEGDLKKISIMLSGCLATINEAMSVLSEPEPQLRSIAMARWARLDESAKVVQSYFTGIEEILGTENSTDSVLGRACIDALEPSFDDIVSGDSNHSEQANVGEPTSQIADPVTVDLDDASGPSSEPHHLDDPIGKVLNPDRYEMEGPPGISKVDLPGAIGVDALALPTIIGQEPTPQSQSQLENSAGNRLHGNSGSDSNASVEVGKKELDFYQLQKKWIENRQPLRAWILAKELEKASGRMDELASRLVLDSQMCWLLLMVSDPQVTLSEEDLIQASQCLYQIGGLENEQKELMVLWLTAELLGGSNEKVMAVLRAVPPQQFHLAENGSLASLCAEHLLTPVFHGKRLTPPRDQGELNLRHAKAIQDATDLIHPGRNNYQSRLVKAIWRDIIAADGPLGRALKEAKQGQFPPTPITVSEIDTAVPRFEEVVAQYRNNMVSRIEQFASLLDIAKGSFNAIREMRMATAATISPQSLKEIIEALGQETTKAWWINALRTGMPRL